MKMFRHTRDGGVSVWLSPGEATQLRTLVVPVLDLLGEGGGPAGRPATAGDPAGAGEDLEKLLAEAVEAAEAAETAEGSGASEPPRAPDDPVLARLLPDAYRDDPEAAGEFRKYTESSLREAKRYFAYTLLETLPPSGGRVRLTADQARDWMRALNDVRLMLGVRLGVTEEFEEQFNLLAPDDPRAAEFEAYGWVSAIQESLVRALDR